MSAQVPAPGSKKPKVKIYDRPERKGLSPTVLIALLVVLAIVIALIYSALRHR
jgi:hypothetical protein